MAMPWVQSLALPTRTGSFAALSSYAMSSVNALPTVGLQQHSRAACFLSKPRARGSPFRPWTASFSTPALALAAKKQTVLCLATAFRKERTHHVDQGTSSGNLFIEIIKAIFRDLQSCVLFIIKQPKELQYLEFPSLQSAGKMAIFTVAVVMVLIVFLATVDSGLSFIAASVFRRIR